MRLYGVSIQDHTNYFFGRWSLHNSMGKAQDRKSDNTWNILVRKIVFSENNLSLISSFLHRETTKICTLKTLFICYSQNSKIKTTIPETHWKLIDNGVKVPMRDLSEGVGYNISVIFTDRFGNCDYHAYYTNFGKF